jgi:transposase-like protein
MTTMTVTKIRSKSSPVKELLSEDREFLKPLIQTALQEVPEAEMNDALCAEKGERTQARLGYRSGYYSRFLITRIGKLELRVPQDRQGRFSTELFERYQRSEKALVAALAEMYVQGVSTRKVKQITEELVAIGQINKTLDAGLRAFCERRLKEPYPYLILDARYEKVREAGVITSQAVLIAIGVDWDGRRQVLAVDLANRESASSWKEFLQALKDRGLKGARRKGSPPDRTDAMRLPRLLQQLLDRGPEALRRGVRCKTGDRVAGAVDQELSEVPLDGPGAEQPALLVLQVSVKRMGA